MYYIKSPSLSVGLASSEPSRYPSLFIPQWTNQMSILPCYKLFGRLQNFCKIQRESSVLLVKSKRGRVLELSTGFTTKSVGSGYSCRFFQWVPFIGYHKAFIWSMAVVYSLLLYGSHPNILLANLWMSVPQLSEYLWQETSLWLAASIWHLWHPGCPHSSSFLALQDQLMSCGSFLCWHDLWGCRVRTERLLPFIQSWSNREGAIAVSWPCQAVTHHNVFHHSSH